MLDATMQRKWQNLDAGGYKALKRARPRYRTVKRSLGMGWPQFVSMGSTECGYLALVVPTGTSKQIIAKVLDDVAGVMNEPD